MRFILKAKAVWVCLVTSSNNNPNKKHKMKTVQKQIDILTARFAALSVSRRKTLAKQANEFISANPGCADHSCFWRTLSARQVIGAAYALRCMSQ